MKATELRIGNIVNVGNLIYCIDSFKGLHEKEVKAFYEPIPLTEEWLLKFGFETQDNGSGTIAVFTKDIAIYHNGSRFFSYNASFYEHDNLIDIKHVHQLQNLYFALTGEELTIKQTSNA